MVGELSEGGFEQAPTHLRLTELLKHPGREVRQIRAQLRVLFHQPVELAHRPIGVFQSGEAFRDEPTR